jgi:hypothetical protein
MASRHSPREQAVDPIAGSKRLRDDFAATDDAERGDAHGVGFVESGESEADGGAFGSDVRRCVEIAFVQAARKKGTASKTGLRNPRKAWTLCESAELTRLHAVVSRNHRS